ncbi:hypothetical protein TNCV_667311 [Trichonephila clavipes]|nr:hypothetical protein TNCV_667311 [Trichonephila clavipes]
MARFRSGHLRSMTFVQGVKSFFSGPCSLLASPDYLLDCWGISCDSCMKSKACSKNRFFSIYNASITPIPWIYIPVELSASGFLLNKGNMHTNFQVWSSNTKKMGIFLSPFTSLDAYFPQNLFLVNLCGRSSLVVSVTSRNRSSPDVTENPRVERLMQVKSVGAQKSSRWCGVEVVLVT